MVKSTERNWEIIKIEMEDKLLFNVKPCISVYHYNKMMKNEILIKQKKLRCLECNYKQDYEEI